MRLKWEETYDKKFLFTQPEKKYFYRIAIIANKDYGREYVAELYLPKYDDFQRLSPWAHVDCNTMLKAKRLIGKHYREVLAKRNGKSRS